LATFSGRHQQRRLGDRRNARLHQRRLERGWVVLAADSPNATAAEDHQDWNWAMLSSVLDYLNKAWPNRNVAGGLRGIFGGAKRSALTPRNS